MLFIAGIASVLLSIILGFFVSGGQLLLLLQWAEFLIILGCLVGSIMVATPLPLLKKVVCAIFASVRPNEYTQQDHLDLLHTLSDLFHVAKREGLRALEQHIEDPQTSIIISNNPKLLENHLVRTFFCDTLKVMLSGGVSPSEIESLMDIEIETNEIENRAINATITRAADSLPGLGIVAAVLGIIVTMSSIDQGAEYVGKHVASALVGTFLGVLLCYGIVSPLAAKVEHTLESKVRLLETLKVAILAWTRGHSPTMTVEMARRTIISDVRPTFLDLERHVRGKSF